MATPLDHRWLNLPPAERVREVGHRRYVGGPDAETWYGIGRLQYHFLISQGLRHDHTFLDVACGALRLGQFLIPYLDQGRYFGLDEEPSLVMTGVKEELTPGIATLKKPNFAFNSTFNVEFADPFDMAIAQSLVTHMDESMVTKCLAALRKKVKPDGRFFFTFFDGDKSTNPDAPYHPNLTYRFKPEDFTPLGDQTGWSMEYLGEWAHPRGQVMMVARPT
ncbi:MAG: class I SAM-dependent methyltransferase [Pseudomonadota bacterium]